MENPTYTPVSRITLTDSVVEQLLDQFRRGSFKPGDRLPTEGALMEKFGVGRSTVREALRSLAHLNLIEARPGAGTVVKSFDIGSYLRPDVFALMLSQSDAASLLEAREVIEEAAIGLAAQRATQADLEALEKVLSTTQRALARNEPTYELSALFHMVVAQAAHNTVLENFMHSIYELLKARGKTTKKMRNFIRWEVDSHQQLYELIKAGDVAGAREAMRDHLRHSAHDIDQLHVN
jgi:GntR family transcriptional repressor for pyruvate dehydrogenase complex